MDYAATSYEDAKQLIKTAQPDWLAGLLDKFKGSYAENPLPWQMGIGAAGGAGLGALSSLWQPKRRQRPLSRALTGGLLGALAGGGYNLITGAQHGVEDQELGERIADMQGKINDLNDQASITGAGNWWDRIRQAWEVGKNGKPILAASEAINSTPALGTITSGHGGDYGHAPEAIGGAAVLARMIRNRAAQTASGKAGPVWRQWVSNLESKGVKPSIRPNPPDPNATGPMAQRPKTWPNQRSTRNGGDPTPMAEAAENAVMAQNEGRAAARSFNPFSKRFYSNTVPEAYNRVVHGTTRRQVMTGKGLLPTVAPEYDYASSVVTPERFREAQQAAKAARGGKLWRGTKAGLTFGAADLLTRLLLELGASDYHGERLRSRQLDQLRQSHQLGNALDALRQELQH